MTLMKRTRNWEALDKEECEKEAEDTNFISIQKIYLPSLYIAVLWNKWIQAPVSTLWVGLDIAERDH